MVTNSKVEQSLIKLLTLIVGEKYIILPEDESNILPYLEESRQRRVGVAKCVVLPQNTEQVSQIIATCRHHKSPVIAQGGNTGRCFGAQSDNANAVIVNLKQLNDIREFDPDNMTITLSAGCILQDVQQYVAEQGYLFPLALGAEGSCQIGGNLASNAGGINVLRYGNTRDLVLGIEAVTANGHILNDLCKLRKNNTGYDLKNLLIGSEGTLAIITAATFKIYPPELTNEHGFIAVNQVSDAVECLQRIQKTFTGKVSSFELIPNIAIQFLEKHSDLKCPIANNHPWYIWYKIADSNSESNLFEENLAFLEKLMEDELVIDATVSQNEAMKQLFWQIREYIVEVQKFEGAMLKFDVSVPISNIATLLEKGNEIIETICPGIRPYPFGHLGDGNIHYNLTRPLKIEDDIYLANYKDKLYNGLHDLVDALDGSFSAEHGVGSQKLAEMIKYKDPVALDMMRRVKHAFDPYNIMNPGKLVPAKNNKE